MLKAINGKINNVVFCEEPNKKKGSNSPYEHDTILKNNIITNSKISIDKIGNSFTIYPIRGLQGSKNSNFYEFLSTGTVPYVVGSLTLMSVFNYANKHFDNFGKTKANGIGKKMALGVLFYGLAKSASQALVTKPVKWATGVDLNLPYARVIYNEPTSKNDTDITRTEYHKVFESVEFPRWDLLYNNEKSGKARNAYYDHIAEKMGLGQNLKDSDQEVKPKIKAVVTKATTVSRITQYLWAGIGVAIAVQKPWEFFFKSLNLHFYKVSEFNNKQKKTFGEKLGGTLKNISKENIKIIRNFGYALKNSIKEFYSPSQETRSLNTFEKHAGKALLLTTIAATVIGDMIACHIPNKPEKLEQPNKVIDKTRKYTVS